MANNTILTPGGEYQEADDNVQESKQYLEIDKFLSEYETENEKSVVRENLNVPSKDSVYTKQDTDIEISKNIRNAIYEYLNMDDPHGIIPVVEQMIKGMLKSDGSTPFTVPQSGVDPISDTHLTTKKFVQRLLKEHINSEDPHKILPEVQELLENYVKLTDIYRKSQLYTKDEISKLLKDYLKKDGTTPFTKSQSGVDPTIDSHLTTKRYVDKELHKHLVDVDPHGFITILNQRLSSYAKKKDYLDKTETYSRTQIDNIIYKLVEQIVEQSIQDVNDDIYEKFENIRKQKYIKSDGSVPFKNPQKGVPAVEEDDLVTLSQLSVGLEEFKPIWVTSGPVESTVGHVDDNTPVPDKMSFQEIMDAIFYGKSLSITVPEYVVIGEKCPITLCIHGQTATIDFVELYQDDEVLYVFTREDFKDGCITVESLPILKDTEFRFKVYYTNETSLEETAFTKCTYPSFIGLLPKWKFGNTITMEYLRELASEDINKTQNQFININPDITSVSFRYEFKDSELKHPFLVVPVTYPNLSDITTKSQNFGIDAFDVIDMIPLQVQGIDVIYKIYIYKQALSSLNQEITFNFKS